MDTEIGLDKWHKYENQLIRLMRHVTYLSPYDAPGKSSVRTMTSG
jgi:hypothetical protein